MAQYTANYQLHQWEAGDNFLRTDFNEDFAKIDAAIKAVEAGSGTAAERMARGLEAAGYLLSSLALRNYYDGKHTGFRQGLLVDGFLNGSGIASQSSSVAVQGGRVRLHRSGQSPVTWSSNTTCNGRNYDLSTPTATVTAPGRVTGVTLRVASDNASNSQQIQFWLNGVQMEAGTIQSPGTANTDVTYTLATPVVVGPGDTFQFKTVASPNGMQYRGNGTYTLAGTANITPLQGSSGWIQTAVLSAGRWDRVNLWLRRQGGTVTPKVNGTALVMAGQWNVQDPDGQSCLEEHWIGGAGNGSLTLRFDLALGSGSSMALLDYGAALF